MDDLLKLGALLIGVPLTVVIVIWIQRGSQRRFDREIDERRENDPLKNR